MDENMVATYCGLCCLDCHGYTGRIARLASDLRRELKKANYDTFAPSMADLPFAAASRNCPSCCGIRDLMAKFRCSKECRDVSALRSAKKRSAAPKKGLTAAGNAPMRSSPAASWTSWTGCTGTPAGKTLLS